MKPESRMLKPSRQMITGEISWAFIALAYAWSGSGGWPFEPGPLHRLVERSNSPVLWMIMMGLPGALLALLAMKEWLSNRCSVPYEERWGLLKLEKSAIWRGRACLALLFSWFYMIKVILDGRSAEGANTSMAIAVGGVVFMGWFYVENRRVRRDVRNQTIHGTLAT